MAQPLPQPKFKVLKALGKGSYGTVYKVQRLEDAGVYAMKETDLSRMGPKERADAVNEIRVLSSMKHPNVVKHHETFVSGNKLCIVMEYAPAGDLSSFLKAAAASRLPLPEATVWQIFLQLCQGMQAIHETCVIHRDIKPANIFMCPDNVVKVGDLGVAKALTKASHAQTVIGTPLYMAPEVWRGLKYSYSSDLWSLGGVLYEMMTHRLPFDARSLNELKNKIIMGSFAPLTPNAPYSAGLVAVCHALLSKDPRRRPTCAAILNSREAAPWLHTIPEAVRLPLPPLDAAPSAVPSAALPAPGGPNPQLLPTIQVPRDIRLLPHRLPKPDYGSIDEQSSGSPAAAAAAAGAPRQQGPAVPAAAGGVRAPSPRLGAAGPSAAAGAVGGIGARPSSAAARAAAGPSRPQVSPRGAVPPSNAAAGGAGGVRAAMPAYAYGGGVPASSSAVVRVRAGGGGALGGGVGAAGVGNVLGGGGGGGNRAPGAAFNRPAMAGLAAGKAAAGGAAAGVPGVGGRVPSAGARIPSAGRAGAAGGMMMMGPAGQVAAAAARPAGRPSVVPSAAAGGAAGQRRGGWPY